MIQVRLTNRVRLKTRLYGIQQFSIANSHELTFPGIISWRAVANAVVGVDGVKITSAKHRESLRRGQRSKRSLEFGGGWAVVTEVHPLTATKAGQKCHGRRKRPVEFSKL